MLYLISKLDNLSLFTIRMGGKIGVINKPIINPHNLHIDGFYCSLPNNPEEQIILDIDIRELTLRGIIINDQNDISNSDDLIRLKDVLDIDYKVLDKPVFASGKKIGKVIDYAFDSKSLYIIKLYVKPPVWQTFTTTDLVIDRTSIIEVSDTKIIVKGPEEIEKSLNTNDAKSKLNQNLSSASNAFIRE